MTAIPSKASKPNSSSIRLSRPAAESAPMLRWHDRTDWRRRSNDPSGNLPILTLQSLGRADKVLRSDEANRIGCHGARGGDAAERHGAGGGLAVRREPRPCG